MTGQNNKETAGQPPFFRKLRNFAKAKARNLFEKGYYSSFALQSGFPAGLSTAGLTIKRNIPYTALGQEDKNLQLDIIRPEAAQGKRLPVFLFVHGGAWRSADKSGFLKVHENLCIRLAQKGVVCVNINHRLAPKYQFPTEEQDVAEAIAWTYRHVDQYGGDREQLFVSGHSSGGHLTALVATAPSYLAVHNMCPQQVIKGVISISGVMDVEAFYQHSKFMGNQAIKPYFGNKTAQHRAASPVHYLSEVTPPFFLAHAEQHDEGLDQQAQQVAAQLQVKRVYTQRKAYPNTDHFLILSKVSESSYPLVDDVFEFMKYVAGL